MVQSSTTPTITDAEGRANAPAGVGDGSARASSARQLFAFADLLDGVLLALGSVGAIAIGCAFPVFGVVLGELIDEIGAGGQASKVQDLAVLILLGAALILALGYFQSACLMASAERQGRRLRVAFMRSVLFQELAWFDREGSPDAVSARITSEVNTVQDAIGDKLGTYVRFMSQFVSGMILGLVQGWELALFILALVPFLACAGGVFMKMTAQAKEREEGAYARAAGVVNETLRNMRTVVAFNAGPLERERCVAREVREEPHTQRGAARSRYDTGCCRYEEALQDSLDSGFRDSWTQGLALSASIGLIYVCYGASFWFGTFLMSNDRSDALDTFAARGCPRIDDMFCATNFTTVACAAACPDIVTQCFLGKAGCYSAGTVIKGASATRSHRGEGQGSQRRRAALTLPAPAPLQCSSPS